MRAVASSISALAVAVLLCGPAGAAEIHAAARAGDLETVEALLTADPALVDAQDDNGATPLHLAARGVHAELARYLVEQGADVTITDANQVIPLHSLAYRGADALVALVISRGADVDAVAVTGATPLHFAIQAGHASTAELLLSRQADLEAADGLGNTPLLLAASYGLREIVEVLLAQGARLDHRNARGGTPLTVAHREGHLEVVQLLVAKGADPAQTEEIALPEGAYLGQEPPGRTAALFAPRFISTERAQLNAVFSPDGREFYFTQRRPGGSAIMVTKMTAARWSRPRPVDFSGPYADVDHFMTRDGRRLFFCSNRSLTPGSGTKPDADIWMTTRSAEGWGDPQHLGSTVNSDAEDYYPTLADDGTLYLSSWRPGGLGDSDIYRSSSRNGALGPPENLGPSVNTPFSEYDPFVAPDHGFLIFSSNRPGGLGDSDLYISFRGSDDSWTEARNMGPGVNSTSSDFTPMLSPDGKYLFLTSPRAGASDIYWVDAGVIERLRVREDESPGDLELGGMDRADPYFGQEPPGLTPQVFAPALLSQTKPEWAFCAEFSPDHQELYFSREDPDRQVDEIVWMRRRTEGWTSPEPLPFNTPHNTNDSRISPDGRRLYYRSQRPLPGRDTSGRFHLWFVERSGDSWGGPRPVLFGGAPGRTSYPGVAADGTLYFSYRAEGNVGESDLHSSALSNDSHAPPENLGPGINTIYAEGDAFVAPDQSYLVVTIWDHPDNSGESDLYISFRQSDGSWSAPQNLGLPINTAGNENCAALSPDGKYFFYVAVRTDGERPTIDTYWVDASILELHRASALATPGPPGP